MASPEAIDTDSEDELPADWIQRVAKNGRVYYANHKSQTTQWEHPVSGKLKSVSGELPYGWEMKTDEKDLTYFIDHFNQRTTYTDPRLAYAEPTTFKPNPVTKRGEVKQRFDANTTALQVLLGRDLSNQYVIVTGANSGLGFETARSLALHGAHVVLACRNPTRAAAAVKCIQAERPQAKVTPMYLDLASLATVKQFCEEYINKAWPLHILVLNAGVFGMPYTQTEDGYESTFQVNYLGHFYLATLLSELLCKSAPSHVVMVTAESHRFTDLTSANMSRVMLSTPEEFYRPILSYNTSKLCCLLLSKELHRRLSPQGVLCNAVHPGNIISTGLSRHSWIWKILFSLLRPFSKSKCEPSEVACDHDTATQLWDASEVMVSQAKTLSTNGLPS